MNDLREWLLDRIDGGEEMRGEDSLISGFIVEIDALEDRVRSLMQPKTLAEWQAAKTPSSEKGATPVESVAAEPCCMEWDTCMKRCVPLAENWRMECKRLERLSAASAIGAMTETVEAVKFEMHGRFDELPEWFKEIWNRRIEYTLAAAQPAHAPSYVLDADEKAVLSSALLRSVKVVDSQGTAAPVEGEALLAAIHERLNQVETEVAVRALGNALLTILHDHVRDMKRHESPQQEDR